MRHPHSQNQTGTPLPHQHINSYHLISPSFLDSTLPASGSAHEIRPKRRGAAPGRPWATSGQGHLFLHNNHGQSSVRPAKTDLSGTQALSVARGIAYYIVRAGAFTYAVLRRGPEQPLQLHSKIPVRSTTLAENLFPHRRHLQAIPS